MLFITRTFFGQLFPAITELRKQLATKKRKRGEKDVDSEGNGRPRKIAKKSKHVKKTCTDESLATGRPKRQIRRTEKAQAMPEPDSDEADSDDESDGSDIPYDDDSEDVGSN
ncbi:hypothetical protein B0H14DRAFT_3443701 [Mycena olivaceomarginata]|nr:hypothetical protein B0H14DRAFT_3443701 [Mycena olivaceomarginata]